jgi:hypothetical protein
MCAYARVCNSVSFLQLWFVIRKLIMITKRVSTQKINLGGKYRKIVNAGFCVSQHGGLGQILQ